MSTNASESKNVHKSTSRSAPQSESSSFVKNNFASKFTLCKFLSLSKFAMRFVCR